MNQSNDRTHDTSVMSSQHGCEQFANSQWLKTLAEKLGSRGLDSRLVIYTSEEIHAGRIEQIVVTNPAARERGEVRIGDDGYVTWEFVGELNETGVGSILDEATNALRAKGVRFRERGSAERTEPAGAREANGS